MAKVSRTKYLSSTDGEYIASDNNDRVFGSAGNDIIQGGGGNDYLFGGSGNDVLAGDKSFFPNVGGDDWLYGGDGDDKLIGMTGNNVLTGGYGKDVFLFNDFLDVNGSNSFVAAHDTVTDFVSGVDRLIVYPKNAEGHEVPLDPAYFIAGTTSPNASHAYILYDRPTGKLYYDVDGSGSAPQILVATLLGQPDLKSSDIDWVVYSPD